MQSTCNKNDNNQRGGIINVHTGFKADTNHHVLIISEIYRNDPAQGVMTVFIDGIFAEYSLVPRCDEWTVDGTIELLPITFKNSEYEKADVMVKNLRYIKYKY